MLHRRQWDRWFMMGSIGITVGIIGYFLFFSIELLSDLKYRTVRCTLCASSDIARPYSLHCQVQPAGSPHGAGVWRQGLAFPAFKRLARPARCCCCEDT